MIPAMGVSDLTISYTDEDFEGECLFDKAPTIGKTYIITANEWEFYLHDVCFFHLIVTIRQYLEQNGIEIPEAFRGTKHAN